MGVGGLGFRGLGLRGWEGRGLGFGVQGLPRPSYVVPFCVVYYNPLPKNHTEPKKGTTLEPLGRVMWSQYRSGLSFSLGGLVVLLLVAGFRA